MNRLGKGPILTNLNSGCISKQKKFFSPVILVQNSCGKWQRSLMDFSNILVNDLGFCIDLEELATLLVWQHGLHQWLRSWFRPCSAPFSPRTMCSLYLWNLMACLPLNDMRRAACKLPKHAGAIIYTNFGQPLRFCSQSCFSGVFAYFKTFTSVFSVHPCPQQGTLQKQKHLAARRFWNLFRCNTLRDSSHHLPWRLLRRLVARCPETKIFASFNESETVPTFHTTHCCCTKGNALPNVFPNPRLNRCSREMPGSVLS